MPIRPNGIKLSWLDLSLCAVLSSTGLGNTALAMEGYHAKVAELCQANGRPAPVWTSDICSTCHTAGSGGGERNSTGSVFDGYMAGTNASLPAILNTFCPSAADGAAGVYYNLNAEGALAPNWQPNPGNIGYTGTLEAHWFAQFDTDNQTRMVSGANARALGAPAHYALMAAPDNCWGHTMNFGLISLQQAATLTVSMAPEPGSHITPGYALYKGWDVGASSSKHQVIYFGDNGVPPGMSGQSASGQVSATPLGTRGLAFIADNLGKKAGETVSESYDLPAGQYELFVTVGDNLSASGGYVITLKTTPSAGNTTAANGVCGSANGVAYAGPPSALGELCQSGEAGPVEPLRHGRYGWVCDFLISGASAQCYTLGDNNKPNQAPLTLTPGSVLLQSGKSIVQRANGGSGNGPVRFKKSSLGSVKCKLKSSGKQVRITAKGEGICRITALKPQSRGFNEVKSAPIDIVVRP